MSDELDESTTGAGGPHVPEAVWELYREAARGTPIEPGDSRLGILQDLTLVVPDPQRGGAPVPAEPRRVERALTSRYIEQVRAAAATLASLPSLMDRVDDEFERASNSFSGGGVDLVEYYEDINARLARASDAAQVECLTSHPGRRAPERIMVTKERDKALLERGIGLRTLYGEVNRRDSWTREWVEMVTTHPAEPGALVRTSDFPPIKMIIFDRTEAFLGRYLPNGELGEGSWHVRHPGIVSLLVESFNVHWRLSTPWTPGVQAPSDPAEGAGRSGSIPLLDNDPRLLSILWGLSSGDGRDRVASLHTMSVKTLDKHLAALKIAMGAQTLFELGYKFGRHVEKHGLDD